MPAPDLRRIALAVGEALIDEFPDRRIVAGAPLHVAAHLADLGWRAMLLTRVGDDADGEQIRATAASLGIDTSLIEIDRRVPTGVTAITLTGTDPTFAVRQPAAWDHLVGPTTVPDHDALVFGTLALRHRTNAATVSRMVAASTGWIVVDANLRAPFDGPEAIRTAVAAADLLKMSDGEVPRVARALDMAPDPEHFGPAWVCVTRGEGGATLHHGDRRWQVPGIPTVVVDTVGAGDAFLATLVDGLIADRDPGEVLHHANAAGARTVAHRGGLPPGNRPPPGPVSRT